MSTDNGRAANPAWRERIERSGSRHAADLRTRPIRTGGRCMTTVIQTVRCRLVRIDLVCIGGTDVCYSARTTLDLVSTNTATVRTIAHAMTHTSVAHVTAGARILVIAEYSIVVCVCATTATACIDRTRVGVIAIVCCMIASAAVTRVGSARIVVVTSFGRKDATGPRVARIICARVVVVACNRRVIASAAVARVGSARIVIVTVDRRIRARAAGANIVGACIAIAAVYGRGGARAGVAMVCCARITVVAFWRVGTSTAAARVRGALILIIAVHWRTRAGSSCGRRASSADVGRRTQVAVITWRVWRGAFAVAPNHKSCTALLVGERGEAAAHAALTRFDYRVMVAHNFRSWGPHSTLRRTGVRIECATVKARQLREIRATTQVVRRCRRFRETAASQ
jgi:hypothetical protein